MTTETKPTPVEAVPPPEPLAPIEELGPVTDVETPAPEPQAEPGKAEKLSYEEWLSHLDKDEELKAAHEERESVRLKEINKETYRKVQASVQPSFQRWADNATQINATLSHVWNTLQKAVADGTLEPEGVASIVQSNPDIWRALNGGHYWNGVHYILAKLGKVGDDETLATEFVTRLDRTAREDSPDPDFASDLIDRLLKPIVEDRYVLKSEHQRLLKRAREEGLKAAKNEENAETREGQGPDTTRKGGGGGLVDPDSIPTNTWITKPQGERDEIKRRWAEHLNQEASRGR